MKSPKMQVAVVVVGLMFAVAIQAQEPSRQSATALATASDAKQVQSETIIPRLIKFSGTLLDGQERPLAGPVGVTFALYPQQTGGAALWMETQNVQPDASGAYVVLLGANSANGVPAELFVSGEARWLGIQVGQQPEHERILLVSVPYALKAGDAETLGGKPLSSFVLNQTQPASTAGKTQTTTVASTKTSAAPQPLVTACASVTSDGTATANSIALFTAPCNIQSSAIHQSGSNVGIGTATPAVAVDVAGNNAGLRLSGTGTHQVTVTGATSGRLGQDSNGFFFASDTNGRSVRFLTNNGTLNEWMRITSAGNIGMGTTTPANKLDVVGSINATGSMTAVAFSGSGSGLTNVNAATLGGQVPGSFATLGANSFVGNQSITGNVGIGTSSPDQQLTVNGGADLWGDGRAFFYVDSGVTLKGYVGPGLNSDLTLVSKRAGDWLRIGSKANSTTLTPIAFWANGNADVDNSPQMVFQSYQSGVTSNGLNPGLLGLGTTAPATPLHVLINTASAGETAWQDGDAITSECFPTANPPLTNLCRAIYARANSTATSLGLGIGVHAIGSGAQSVGIQAEAINGAQFAGEFIGDVNVTGNLSKGSGSFKIDHPLDPEHKILYHSFVESPDMKNVYDGVATLDAEGQAWVKLPAYFEALNKDFRYQLTAIGAPAPGVYIAQEVRGNRFQIAGGMPGGKISWQVTGIRQDAFAEKHRIQVEAEKPVAEQGFYLYPDAYGQPEEKGVAWARKHPPAPAPAVPPKASNAGTSAAQK